MMIPVLYYHGAESDQLERAEACQFMDSTTWQTDGHQVFTTRAAQIQNPSGKGVIIYIPQQLNNQQTHHLPFPVQKNKQIKHGVIIVSDKVIGI